MQHAIVIFSGAISCVLYLLISLQWGGSFLANLLPFFPLFVMFGLSLIRKDGRNLFDLLGRKIVKKKSDNDISLQRDTATKGRLREPVNGGLAALYWRCGLGLTALTLVFSTVFSLFACQSLEQSCQLYEQQMQQSTKGKVSNALAKTLPAASAKQHGLESYYYVKALVYESIGNREAANQNLNRAISLKERSLFEFEKAKNLRALGRLEQAIDSATRAIVLMQKGKQNDALCTIVFGKSKRGFNMSLGEDLTLENLLIMRGKTYLELKTGSKYFAEAKQRGRDDLNAAIALVNIDVAKEPSAKLYRHRSELHELAGNVQSAIADRKAADLRLRQEAEVKVDGVTFEAGTH